MRIEVYIPSTGTSESDTFEVRKVRVASYLTSLFGGCTLTSGEGHWLDKSGEQIHEEVSIAIVFVEDDEVRLVELKQTLFNHVFEWCRLWRQDCMLVTIDNAPHFIS